MRHLFAPLSVALLLAAASGCTTKTVAAPAPAAQGAEAPEPTVDEEVTPEAQAETFGAALDPSAPVVALTEILASPESFKDRQITTTGNVHQVCQKRGCWAEIRPSAAAEGAAMRVTFKGYAFFLPKDAKGADVKIEGRVSVELLSAEHVAHLESEGATFADKKADGSAVAIELVASGVEMTGRKK